MTSSAENKQFMNGAEHQVGKEEADTLKLEMTRKFIQTTKSDNFHNCIRMIISRKKGRILNIPQVLCVIKVK
jgi:hypothetical protein